jgi:hypothetical protein
LGKKNTFLTVDEKFNWALENSCGAHIEWHISSGAIGKTREYVGFVARDAFNYRLAPPLAPEVIGAIFGLLVYVDPTLGNGIVELIGSEGNVTIDLLKDED